MIQNLKDKPDPSDSNVNIVFTMHKFGTGGTDRVCIHLANGFAEAGFSVSIIVFCMTGEGKTSLTSQLNSRVRLIALGKKSISRSADLIRLLPRLTRQFRRLEPAFIVSSGNNMNWVTAAGFKRANLKSCKLVLKITNPCIRPHDSAASALLRQRGFAAAFNVASMILVLSEEDEEILKTQFPAAAGKIHNGLNPYVTDAMVEYAAQRSASKPGSGKLIVSVGRLSYQKRHELLIEAFSHVQTVDARLAIPGEGPLRGKLEAQARQLGVYDRIEFPGYQPDIAPWLDRADLFVLCSRYEGLPAVVLESLVFGTPVLTTDCFPSARRLMNKNGMCGLIEDLRPEAIARKIDQHLLESGKEGLTPSVEPYRVNNAVQSHIDLIRSIL